MKLVDKILSILESLEKKFQQLVNQYYEGITVVDSNEYDDGSFDIEFSDSENSLVVYFTFDDDLSPIVIINPDYDAEGAEEDYIDLSDIIELNDDSGKHIYDLNNLSWLTEDIIDAILFGEEISERKIMVIRGGKKVKKTIKRRRRIRKDPKRRRAAKKSS